VIAVDLKIRAAFLKRYVQFRDEWYAMQKLVGTDAVLNDASQRIMQTTANFRSLIDRHTDRGDNSQAALRAELCAVELQEHGAGICAAARRLALLLYHYDRAETIMIGGVKQPAKLQPMTALEVAELEAATFEAFAEAEMEMLGDLERESA